MHLSLFPLSFTCSVSFLSSEVIKQICNQRGKRKYNCQQSQKRADLSLHSGQENGFSESKRKRGTAEFVSTFHSLKRVNS